MRTVDEVELFRVFEQVVETGSFSTASQSCGISRSAVSRRISKLEATVGAELFVRESQGTQLTPAGFTFSKRLQSCLKEFDALCRPTFHSQPATESVRVSAPSAIGNGLLIPWIAEFQAAHPHVMVDLTLTLGPVRMMPPGCDIRISHGLFPCERVRTRPLGTMLRMMVASPAYLAQHDAPVRPEQLSSHSLLGGNDLLDGRPLVVVRGCERVSVPHVPRLRLHDHGAARTAALAGIGIAVQAFVYDTMDFVRRGMLIHVLPDWEPESAPVSMLLPADRPLSAAAGELADLIKAKWLSHPNLGAFDPKGTSWQD